MKQNDFIAFGVMMVCLGGGILSLPIYGLILIATGLLILALRDWPIDRARTQMAVDCVKKLRSIINGN